MQHGALLVPGDNKDKPYQISLEGAKVIKEVDPSDSSARIVISYIPENSPARETIILMPPVTEVDAILTAIRKEITAAALNKSNWSVRLAV